MMYDGHVVGRWRVGLGLGMKVYDGELVGIARALTSASRTSLSFKHIWIFTDNQAAIINSFRLSPHPGQQVSLQIQDSVAVTTTAKEKTTPNSSPSPHLIAQQPFLTASPPHFTHFYS